MGWPFAVFFAVFFTLPLTVPRTDYRVIMVGWASKESLRPPGGP